MKYIIDMIEELRRYFSKGSRITKDDSASRPVEMVDEAPRDRVEILEEPVVKTLELRPPRPPGEVYALDSSSRAVETPYVFIAVGAGSIFSRFSGVGIDVPHVSSMLGVDKPLCDHMAIIPEIEFGKSLTEILRKLPGIVLTNPIGILYTSEYNKHMVLAELRLSMENCILLQFLEHGYVKHNTTIFVDGPLVYPLRIVEGGSTLLARERAYVESIRSLNFKRVNTVTRLLNSGAMVIGVVKRLSRSYYLSSIDPANMGVGKVNDEAYITSLLAARGINTSKLLIVGPMKIKHETGIANRVSWYVVVPRRIYPLAGGFGNYVVYRVEVLETDKQGVENALNYVFYDSICTGSMLPLSLLIVDRRVKRITSSVVNSLLYVTGQSEESTGRYISVL